MARHSKSAAARQLGISRTTLYRLIEHGLLSADANGHIDDTELIRAAPQVDAIKERLATSSDRVQERHNTSSDRPPFPQQFPDDERGVTPSDRVQERHDTLVTGRHWTDDTLRYWTHLEGEVDTLRAQVNRLHAQVERLHDELRDARLARERAQEETQTERLRYMQMLEEFSRRYDRFLDAPRATAPRSPQEAPGATQTPEPPGGERDRARTRPSASQLRRRGIFAERCVDVSWPCSKSILRVSALPRCAPCSE